MLSLIIALSTASAATLTVCDTGCDADTIQGAIDLSASGDVVRVSSGDYEESLSIVHDLTVEVSGRSGWATVIGDGTQPVLTVSAGAAVSISDVELTEGGGDAGILNYGDLTLSGVHITDHAATFGGIANFGDMRVEHYSVISGNVSTSYLGGGASNYGTMYIVQSTVIDNEGYYGGGLMNYGGYLSVGSSTVALNDAYLGGGIHNSYGDVFIGRSTLTQNTAHTGGAYSNHNIGGTMTINRTSYAANSASVCGTFIDVSLSTPCQ